VTTPRRVRRRAHAKINVFLRVLGERVDGYHDLESLVLPVSLWDDLTVSNADRLHVDVRSDDQTMTEGLSEGGLNLAIVAALALAEQCGVPSRGAEIEIVKRIPVAGGLGGGSADAAATLVALDELWECGLAAEELRAVAERVGSDVPAMLEAEPVMIGGRGERISSVVLPEAWWVLHPFDFPVRSPDAYRWWDEDRGRPGPDPGALVAAAQAGRVDLLGSALFNDLEAPVARRHPPIAEVRDAFLAAGAAGAVMAGSGPTVVALARDRSHAEKLADAVPPSIVVSGPPPAG
jgi:4-diphosphocytidyl-2-C-methyl-D-erythritol kinase